MTTRHGVYRCFDNCRTKVRKGQKSYLRTSRAARISMQQSRLSREAFFKMDHHNSIKIHHCHHHYTVQVAICTLVNALVLRRKHHQHKLHSVKTVLGTSHKSRMQQPNAGSTIARFARGGALVHFHQLAQILHLHSWWSSPTATYTGGIFSRSTGSFTNVHIATCSVWWYICIIDSMAGRSIAYISDPRRHITNMQPRLDIEAMDRPTILYMIYRMVSAQQTNLFTQDSRIFSMQFFTQSLICLITKLVAIHNFLWNIFASWWKEKHHQRKLHSVKTILGTSIGAGCSNQMQVAQGQDLH